MAGVPPPEFVAGGVVESLLLQLSSPTIAATIKQTVTRPISWLPCFFRPISNPTGTSAMGASTDASQSFVKASRINPETALTDLLTPRQDTHPHP